MTIANGLAAILLAAVAPTGAQTAPDEAALTEALKGRTATAERQECIPLRHADDRVTVPHTALILGSGKRVWVNRPRSGLETFDDKVILVSRTPSRQVCRTDVVEMIDRNSRVPIGFLQLGDFVAYERR